MRCNNKIYNKVNVKIEKHASKEIIRQINVKSLAKHISVHFVTVI